MKFLILLSLFICVNAFAEGNYFCSTPDKDYNGNIQYRADTEGVAHCKRNVTAATKTKIYKMYGITDRTNYCIDHGVSLFAGGNNNIDNLWPNLKDMDGQCGKEGLEKSVYMDLKNGIISTKRAQQLLIDYVANRKRDLYNK